MRVKNADFAAKFEKWYVQNPDECYGEMSYTNNEADIRTAWNKYWRIYNSGHTMFMQVACLLAGIVMLSVNTLLYMAGRRSFDIYYSGSSFGWMTVLGIAVLLIPLWDSLGCKYKAGKRIKAVLASGCAGMTCGCRFCNDRVEFISDREHVIYPIADIEYIYECTDGLYFMLYGGGLRYIPARFFDSEFACLVTERLSVSGFDIYRRRQYMAVQSEAEDAGDFSPPEIEPCEPVSEFSYIIDRPAARRLTGCGRLRPLEWLHFTMVVLLAAVMVYIIFFRGMDTLLNRGILILDVIYTVICLLMHLSGIPLECDRYTGKYLTRLFDGHMSVISGSSVTKIDYRTIHSAKRRDGCCIFTVNGAEGRRDLLIPDYALPDAEAFVGFMQSKDVLKQH